MKQTHRRRWRRLLQGLCLYGLLCGFFWAYLTVGFYGLGLHKIFARCMPENTPSRNLLHATGFFEEGIERDSILIQGKWENHIRYAILNPDEIHS